MLFSYLAHRRQCKLKQEERLQRIASLPSLYHEHISSADNAILDLPISSLISAIQDGKTEPLTILRAYGKKALRAHAQTNCLTEIMIGTAEVWAQECNRQGPLAGVPVSLKDTVGVKGWDSCIGYSAWVGQPLAQDSALIRLLRDAGAVPFVKTNIPITLLSFESVSDVFGRTTNPHNSAYSPGGSTGGEAALLAYGGSRIGIGTDVAGSVRVPAHYSGIYTIKASVGRFLRNGNNTSIPGQEGVSAVYSPMARTLEDLETFWKGIFAMNPWKYDASVLPIPWRSVDLSAKKLRWGILWDDGVVSPSPACKRALQIVVDTLTRDGHEVLPINPPSPYEALKIGSQLILADGCQTVNGPIGLLESNDAGVHQLSVFFALPSFLRRIYVWYIKYIKRDALYADLLSSFNPSGSTFFGSGSIGVSEFWPLVAKKEAYKNKWFEYWDEQDLDFILTVPNAFPACPHRGMRGGFTACGYTFLFNVLDYTAGVLPVTRVNSLLDARPHDFRPRNAIERSGYKDYDSLSMAGLPVGVQVVGRRLEEEKVLEGMKLIEDLLRKEGKAYTLLKT
ncbi:amidase signature enzyme [Pluteus cervinus]|uniref:Amidase signature enzyme n=1 Tax=Pluteus cervinus TaxID=181527 RepID=A0ACD3ARF5_9AGAR|nr:amidase signature enzyme [Pluteus cervinus]